MFRFPLESLLRYRAHRRDLVRQLLARILESDGDLRRENEKLGRMRDDVLNELRNQSAGGTVDVDRLAARRYFAGQLLGEIRLTERNRQLVGQQLESCRQSLIEADRDVKVLENLKQRRQSEYDYARQRREQLELEDAWLAAHVGEFCG